MANTIEAGVFAILLILAFIPFLPGRIRLVSILSMVIFAGLGLTMAAHYDVVVTKVLEVPDTVATTETAITRDYIMNVTQFTTSVPLYGASANILAEYVPDANSALYGESIECIALQYRKANSPTGNADIGVFNSTGDLVKSFGVQDVALATTSNIWYGHCLSDGDSYVLRDGDRVGIKYTGGDATNNLVVIMDGNNPFDGTNSYRQTFVGGTWTTTSTGHDVTMQLWRGVNEVSSVETTTYKESPETTPVINQFHIPLAYTFFGLALFSFYLFMKELFDL